MDELTLGLPRPKKALFCKGYLYPLVTPSNSNFWKIRVAPPEMDKKLSFAPSLLYFDDLWGDERRAHDSWTFERRCGWWSPGSLGIPLHHPCINFVNYTQTQGLHLSQLMFRCDGAVSGDDRLMMDVLTLGLPRPKKALFGKGYLYPLVTPLKFEFFKNSCCG